VSSNVIQSDDTYVYINQPDTPQQYGTNHVVRTVIRKADIIGATEQVMGYDQNYVPQWGVMIAMSNYISYQVNETWETVMEVCGLPLAPVDPPA
jgi:hypothetical protein